MKRILFLATAFLALVAAYGPPQTSNQIPQSGSGCGPGGCRNVGTTSTGCGPGGCPGAGGCGPGGCPGGAGKPYWWEGSKNPFKGCIPGTPRCRISLGAPSKGSQGRPVSVSSVHTVSVPSSPGCTPGTPGCPSSSYPDTGSPLGQPGCAPGQIGCGHDTVLVDSRPSVHSDPGPITTNIHSVSQTGCSPGQFGCAPQTVPISPGHIDSGTVTTNIHSVSQSGCAPGQFGCDPDPVPFDSSPIGHSGKGTVTTNVHSISSSGCAPGQFGCAPQTVPVSSGHIDSGTVTTNIHSVSQSGCTPGQFGCDPAPVPFDSSPIGQSGTGSVTTNIHSVSQPGCAPGQFGCAPQSVPTGTSSVQHSPSGCRPGTANCGPYEEDIGTDIVIDIIETPEKPVIQFPSHSPGSISRPRPTQSFSQSIKPSSGFPRRPSSGVHSVPGVSNDYSDSKSSGSFVSNTQSFPSQNQHQGTFDSGQYKPSQQRTSDSGQYKPSQRGTLDSGQYQPSHQGTTFDSGQYQPSHQGTTFDSGQYQPSHHFSSGGGSFQSNVPGVPFRQGDINPEDLRPISTGVSLNGVNMMMMPMAMPLPGGSCSAGSFCVPPNTCNPYNGFIIRNVNMIAAVRRDQPQVPLLECFVPAGVLSDGVCCQESHPIAGTGLD